MPIKKPWVSEEQLVKGGMFTPAPHTHSRSEVGDFWSEAFWGNIPDKPSTFPPSSHMHDDRYYTETELNDGQLDTRYFTKSQINTYLEAQDELAEMLDVDIGVPESGSLLEYWTSDNKWHDVVDLPPTVHASSHHSGQSDPVNHDSLAGFLAAEHVSLPNTIANVLSNHNKIIHDSLDIDARYIDGQEVVAVNPSNNEVLTYILAETRWEAKPVPAGTLAGLTDTNIGAPESGEILEYSEIDSKWHNIALPAPATHASTHHSGGSDQVNHDSLTGFEATEHLSLPNTIANVLSNHTKAVHDGLDIDARYIDGKEVVAATPTDGYVLMYVSANTRWEDKPIGASVALADLTDTNIGAPENGEYLMYLTSDNKWHNVSDPSPSPHTLASHSSRAHSELTGVTANLHHPQSHTLVSHTARDHHNLIGLGDDDHSQYYNSTRHTKAVHDALNIDADLVDGRHLPNTIAQVLTNHTKAVHDALLITALGSGALAKDHGTASIDMLVNVSFGTGNPPAADTTTHGSLFIKYTA